MNSFRFEEGSLVSVRKTMRRSVRNLSRLLTFLDHMNNPTPKFTLKDY